MRGNEELIPYVLVAAVLYNSISDRSSTRANKCFTHPSFGACRSGRPADLQANIGRSDSLFLLDPFLLGFHLVSGGAIGFATGPARVFAGLLPVSQSC